MKGQENSSSKKSLVMAVAVAGLVAGVLDGIAACTTYMIRGGQDLMKVWNFVSSGVFGQDGLTGGTPMALAGIFFHMCIAMMWATIYFLIYPRVSWLSRNWVVSGLLYGIVVWVGMNLVVVPLSLTPPSTKTVQGVLIGCSILMVFIGLPVSYFASKYFRPISR